MKNRENMMIYILIIIGILFRIVMCIVHFTHIDDIGVANSLINLSYFLGDDEIEITKGFCEFWTYAPFQSLFTQKLVNSNLNYYTNILMGRLPSLICSILYIIIVYKILCKCETKEKISITFIICIICLSWENIIYSAQMEPYAIGIMFSSIIVYSIFDKFYDCWYKTVLTMILFVIAGYAQYQMFILLFAVYVAAFICNFKNKSNLIRITATGTVNFAASIPLLSFLFTSGKLQQGVNGWNVGKDSMFMYKNLIDGGVFDKIQYIIVFFARNFFLCFKYLFLADSFKYISNILTIVLILFAGLGVYHIHKNKDYIFFAVFHDILTGIMLVMIIKGSLTLGPSRHILIMEPVWIVLIYFGIIQLQYICNMRVNFYKVVSVMIFFVVMLFIFSLPSEISTRKNFISEAAMTDLIDKYAPEFVFAEHNLTDLYLFNIDGYSNKSEPTGRGWLQDCNQDVCPKANDTIILMSKNYNIDEIKNSESSMRQQLEERIKFFGYDQEWANIDNYVMLYEKEVKTDTEVEYAREYYWNFPNELHLYVLSYCGN